MPPSLAEIQPRRFSNHCALLWAGYSISIKCLTIFESRFASLSNTSSVSIASDDTAICGDSTTFFFLSFSDFFPNFASIVSISLFFSGSSSVSISIFLFEERFFVDIPNASKTLSSASSNGISNFILLLPFLLS